MDSHAWYTGTGDSPVQTPLQLQPSGTPQKMSPSLSEDHKVPRWVRGEARHRISAFGTIFAVFTEIMKLPYSAIKNCDTSKVHGLKIPSVLCAMIFPPGAHVCVMCSLPDHNLCWILPQKRRSVSAVCSIINNVCLCYVVFYWSHFESTCKKVIACLQVMWSWEICCPLKFQSSSLAL